MKKAIFLLGLLAAVGTMQLLMQAPPGSGGHSEVDKNDLGGPNPRQICRKREKEAYRISQEAMRRALKAPATAVFSDRPISLLNTDWCKYSVVAHFDAQNVNGALLRSRYSVHLKYDHIKRDWYAGTPYVQDYSLTTLTEPESEEVNPETLFRKMSDDMKAYYVYGSFCNKLMPDVATDNLRKIDRCQLFFTGTPNLVDKETQETFEAKNAVDNDEAQTKLVCAIFLEKHANAYNANAAKYNVTRNYEWPLAPLLAIPDWGSYE